MPLYRRLSHPDCTRRLLRFLSCGLAGGAGRRASLLTIEPLRYFRSRVSGWDGCSDSILGDGLDGVAWGAGAPVPARVMSVAPGSDEIELSCERSVFLRELVSSSRDLAKSLLARILRPRSSS